MLIVDCVIIQATSVVHPQRDYDGMQSFLSTCYEPEVTSYRLVAMTENNFCICPVVTRSSLLARTNSAQQTSEPSGIYGTSEMTFHSSYVLSEKSPSLPGNSIADNISPLVMNSRKTRV